MRQQLSIAAMALALVAFLGLGLYFALDMAYGRGYAAHEKLVQQAISQGRVDQAEQKAKDAKQETKIVTEFVEVEKKVYIKGDTIIKEVPVYVSAKSDSACVVPLGFVSLHDRAAISAGEDDQEIPARDPAARSTAVADDLPVPEWAEQPSGVPLSTVAKVSAENSKRYKALAARFNALREFATTQCYEPQI